MIVGRASFHHLAHPLGDDAHYVLNLHVAAVAAAGMVAYHCFDFRRILVDWVEVDIEIVVDAVVVDIADEFADTTSMPAATAAIRCSTPTIVIITRRVRSIGCREIILATSITVTCYIASASAYAAATSGTSCSRRLPVMIRIRALF